MKKYLIKGTLALFAGAFLFSCSEKETDYVPISKQKVETFEKVFKEVYGEPAPDHNWGFSTITTLADSSTTEVIYKDSVVTESTRSDNRVRTRGHDANANLWGRYYTNVPDVLTSGQKLRVRLYFQYNKDPRNEPVSYSKFFVQDVYKGGGNPLWKDEDGYRGYSKEAYLFGGELEIGSNHMDKLTAGYSNDHINNYNYAQCTTNYKVWDGHTYDPGYPLDEVSAAALGIGDWEAENYNHVVYHQDEIMLMVNSSTACFGWHESQGDIQHNDQYVIISGSTIDSWASTFASQHPDMDLGSSVSGRGFVGFDYEAKVDASDIFQDPNGWDEWVGKDEETQENIFEHHDGPRKNEDGIPYVSSGAYDNQASMTVVSAGTSGAYPVWERYVDNDQSKGNVWVKVGCADGYYSDWIVCIVEAIPKELTSRIVRKPKLERTRIPLDEQCGRIFAEDLSVSAREDLDFNDVVFDVDVYKNFEEGWVYFTRVWSDGTEEELPREWYSTKEDGTYSAEITLQAAGGTLPLTVAGVEVHNAFDVGITTMVNTRDDNSTAFGSYVVEYSPVYIGEFTTSQLNPLKADTDPILASDIPIVVQYNNGTNKDINFLEDELGGAPAKLFVPNHTTKWTVERKPLSLAYPDFYSYVGDKSVKWWEGPSDQGELERASYYRYNNVTHQGAATPPIVITRIIYPGVSQDELWTGSESYTTWALKRIKLDYDTYYPGDFITFYVEDLTDDSYITVVFADDSKPYFIDTPIRNYDVDKDGNKTMKTSGVIEVKLDEDNAKKLSASKKDGQQMIQVQGRNFKLTRIGRTLFQ
jgi:hypothetical protein